MRKKLFLALALVVLSLVFVACGHEHTYGDWTITEEPTLTEVGTAERTCTEDDYTEEVEVPVLTDSIWTKVTVPATCEEEGSETYTSIYGEVVVKLAKLGHEYSDWELVVEPTEENEGSAKRTCALGNHTEEVEVPALTDEEVWEVVIVPATCEETGTKTYTSIYGEVVVVLEILDHEYGDWELVDEPTETKTGTAKRTCTLGNHSEEVEVPVLTDEEVWEVVIVPATCEEAGSKTYTSDYGEVVIVIEKLAHEYGEWTLVDEPTETKTGTAKRTCTLGNHTEEVEVPVLTAEEVWEVEIVPATCEEAGSKTYTSIYGEVVVVIEKPGHEYGDWELVVEPTEETVGKAERTCTIDGHKEVVDVPVLTDEEVWEVVIVPATCEETGTKTYTSIYGVVVVVLEILDHEYGDWELVDEPTETKTGTAKRTCTLGNHSEEVEVPVLTDEEVWEVVIVPATCEEEGSKTYTSDYGEVVVVLEKLAHEYGEWTLVDEPTETKTGTAKRTCTLGNHTEEVEVPVLTAEEVWEVVIVPATCEEAGSKTYTSIYGELVVIIEKLGHEYGEWELVVEPTEETVGQAERTCTIDGHKEVVDVPVLTAEEVWEVEIVEPDYNNPGTKTYESIYGVVVVELAKLVAPYDNKTYSSFALDARLEDVKYKNSAINALTSWNRAEITLDENGSGYGTAHPFNGDYIVEMVNPLTGRVNIIITPYRTNEDGISVPDPSRTRTHIGYVDMNTGIIIKTNDALFNYVHVVTPFETEVAGDQVLASSWDNALAVQYTFAETTYNIFVYNEVAYFGVLFADAAGNALAANECYQADYVYISDNTGTELFAFAHDGTKLVPTDGFEGTYSLEDNVLILSGHGLATYNGTLGTYELAPVGSDYTVGLYVSGVFSEVTLDEVNKTYTIVKPMVSITLDGGEFADNQELEVNKNIEYVLPKLDHEFQTFKGWFYDAGRTNPVETNFKPTADITLYADWAPKVIIYLDGVLPGDPEVLYLGEGDLIRLFLPVYNIDLENYKLFRGWYLDEEYTSSLPEEAEVQTFDSGLTIYAKWDDLPAYYGTYKGTEIWYAGNGNYRNATLTIDENGNISGQITGIIDSYDPVTQMITWKVNEEATDLNYFWFDAETDVIAGIYNNNEIGNNYYIFGKYQTTNKMDAYYGVNAPKEPGSSVIHYYAQFVRVMTKDGLRDIFLYNNYIYSNVIIENTAGDVLPISEIKDSKTVVVRDATTNEILIGLASIGESFAKNTTTAPLDTYYGIYISGDEEIVLDGTGIITYGEKTGTYTESTSELYGFDVFLENESEYYRLTLVGESFVIEKPMVVVEFEVGAEHTPIEAREYNMNVAGDLPSGEDLGWVFNGWFFDAEFTQSVPAIFIPTDNMTIYAKYSVPSIITIVYNNGDDNDEVIYSVGDITDIPKPVFPKYKFLGWYTTPTFEEGSEWESGEAILESLTIYAKWEVAPPYNNLYVPTELKGVNENGAVSSKHTWTSAIADIDPDGYAPQSGSPFRPGPLQITDYDPLTGTLVFNMDTNQYRAFLHAESGLMILNFNSGLTTELSQVYLLTPFETGWITTSISSSYWNSGKTRAIQYTFEETTYSIFIFNDQVYFDVEFKDINDEIVLGVECYQASTLFVYDSLGNLISKFGHDGSTMQPLDGYEGFYSLGEDTLVLNGIDTATLNGIAGLYSKVEEIENTFYVYIENVCYEVVINQTEMTYSITIPMVTITYDGDSKVEIEPVVVNKNIEFTLPVPKNDDFKFRGWYADPEFETEVSKNYLPVSDATLYAKWDIKVTLTIVYGNGKDIFVDVLGQYDEANLTEPGFTNDKVFDGWFLDEEFTIPYVPGVILEDTTIYCKWKDPIALTGSYNGIEIYGSSKKGRHTFNRTQGILIIDPEGSVTGQRTGEIEEYDPETGTFKIVNSPTSYYWGKADLVNDLLVISYDPNKDDFGNDMHIYINGADSVNGSDGSYWQSGTIRLMTLVITGHERESMNLFIYNNQIYVDVTWTSDDGSLTAKEAWEASQLTVLDSSGNAIANFVQDVDAGLIEVE